MVAMAHGEPMTEKVKNCGPTMVIKYKLTCAEKKKGKLKK